MLITLVQCAAPPNPIGRQFEERYDEIVPYLRRENVAIDVSKTGVVSHSKWT